LKKLEDMSLEELWELFPIVLEEHNPNYAISYSEEKEYLIQILNTFSVRRINHIGSTSVDGMIAKPIIDILMELPSNYEMSAVAEFLKKHSWLVMAQNDAEKTIDLNKGYTPRGYADRVFHLHIKPHDDWGELYFRDYLRQHSDVARQYESLKFSLKKQFEPNRDAYTNAKTDFVLKYTEIARKEFTGRYLPF